jgi:myosin heavy subunit
LLSEEKLKAEAAMQAESWARTDLNEQLKAEINARSAAQQQARAFEQQRDEAIEKLQSEAQSKKEAHERAESLSKAIAKAERRLEAQAQEIAKFRAKMEAEAEHRDQADIKEMEKRRAAKNRIRSTVKQQAQSHAEAVSEPLDVQKLKRIAALAKRIQGDGYPRKA